MANKSGINGEWPILETIKKIIPPVDEVAEAIKREHDTAARISRLMLLVYASITELAELVSQLQLDAGDISSAQKDLVNQQARDEDMLDRLADRNAGARTVLMNLDVYIRHDPVSIAHILQVLDDDTALIDAARNLDPLRIRSIINALLVAIRE